MCDRRITHKGHLTLHFIWRNSIRDEIYRICWCKALKILNFYFYQKQKWNRSWPLHSLTFCRMGLLYNEFRKKKHTKWNYLSCSPVSSWRSELFSLTRAHWVSPKQAFQVDRYIFSPGPANFTVRVANFGFLVRVWTWYREIWIIIFASYICKYVKNFFTV